MRCGTPTITGNRTCFPEIIGEAGLLIDPFDECAMSEAMLSILKNEKLRDELIDRGFQRARLYDWTKTASQTLQVYQTVHANDRLNSNKITRAAST